MAKIGAIICQFGVNPESFRRFVEQMEKVRKAFERLKARVEPFREPLPSEEAKRWD